MTVKEAYSYGVSFLSGNGVDESEFKSLCVVCHLAGISNSQFHSHQNDDIIMSRFADMLWRLKTGEPLQYVLGKWDFYDSEFYVGKGVLIPRPETEELVDLAIKHIKALGKCVVYDLCAGSGCIGVSIAKACPNATVYMIEKSREAMTYLIKNSNGIDNAKPVCADIISYKADAKADVIISNPPYIKSRDVASLQKEVLLEPVMALDGGEDGLDFYRIINDKWSGVMNDNAHLFLEIGNEQGESILDVLTNFSSINVIKDMYGNDRIVTAVKKG